METLANQNRLLARLATTGRGSKNDMTDLDPLHSPDMGSHLRSTKEREAWIRMIEECPERIIREYYANIRREMGAGEGRPTSR